MQNLKNNLKEKEQQLDIKTLMKENKNLIELLQASQVQEISSNQKVMNQWLIQEISSIKSGVNQIGLILSNVPEDSEDIVGKSSKDEEDDEEDEDEEDLEEEVQSKEVVPKEIPKFVQKETPKFIPKKLPVKRDEEMEEEVRHKKKSFFGSISGYGTNLKKEMKEADPDNDLE